MKVTFLLGSGISIPAKLPSVGELTSAVLSGELQGGGLYLGANGVLCRQNERAGAAAPENPIEHKGRKKLRCILMFLDWLKVQVNARYAEIEERGATYEDLAYLAGQMGDDLIGEYENPALQPFIRNALVDLGGLFSNPAPDAAREELRELAETTVDYIRQVVELGLNPSEADDGHLEVFACACRDPLVREVNLFTLNHDTLLERFLRKKGTDVVDGLREASNKDGSRRWDPSVFDNPQGERRVNLFKLHGSVGWWRWEPRCGTPPANVPGEKADRDGRFVGTYTSRDTNRPLYEKILENEGPQFLAGTFNKILGYNSGLFLELQHRFHRALQDCTTLVVCGYGFGDKGINTRIAEWRHRPEHPKILIIDPAAPSVLVRKARGAIQREIAALDPDAAIDSLPLGLVIHWQNGLEEGLKSTGDRIITWERIRAVLRDC